MVSVSVRMFIIICVRMSVYEYAGMQLFHGVSFRFPLWPIVVRLDLMEPIWNR